MLSYPVGLLTLLRVRTEKVLLTVYYIRRLLYDIVTFTPYAVATVTLRFSHGFSSKRIGYNTNCIGAVTQSKAIGTKYRSLIVY